MYKIIILLILITGFCNGHNTIRIQCKSCVKVDECPLLKTIFIKKPYSSQSLNFFSTLACGFQNFVPKVCCDENFIINFYKKEIKNSKLNIKINSKQNDVNFKLSDPKEDVINKYCKGNKESKIIGGITAALGLFPWMAKLGYATGGSQMMLMKSDEEQVVFRCGGSLITKRHVLTAAHCISNLPKNMTLELIVLDADGEPQKRHPALLLPHSKFENHFTYDLGIIKMDRSVEFTDTVRPICLPIGPLSLDPAELLPRMLMVAGWGALASGSKIMSPRLRYTRLTYFPHEECRRLYRNQFNVTLDRSHLCTVPDTERDACAGDSGGPLFSWTGDESSSQAVVLAIVSFGGKQCAARNIPGVYTRIDMYQDWIQKTVLK